MDWTAEEIRSNPFTHYELDNESRALSGYHVYTKCAFKGYTTMDEAQRLVYIMQTHNLNDEGILDDEDIADIIDSSDFQAKKVVIGVWRLMSEGKKSAWKERANLLNNRPLLGQVEELPEDLAAMNLLQLQDLVRECIRIDLSLLEKMLKRALRNENQRDLGKKRFNFLTVLRLNLRFIVPEHCQHYWGVLYLVKKCPNFTNGSLSARLVVIHSRTIFRLGSFT